MRGISKSFFGVPVLSEVDLDCQAGDAHAMDEATRKLLATLAVEQSIAPTTLVRSLPVAQQQLVEIAKALSFEARILVMDEPTAALPPHEVEALFRVVRRLRERGLAI